MSEVRVGDIVRIGRYDKAHWRVTHVNPDGVDVENVANGMFNDEVPVPFDRITVVEATSKRGSPARLEPTDTDVRKELANLEVPLPNGYQFLRLGRAGADAILARFKVVPR